MLLCLWADELFQCGRIIRLFRLSQGVHAVEVFILHRLFDGLIYTISETRRHRIIHIILELCPVVFQQSLTVLWRVNEVIISIKHVIKQVCLLFRASYILLVLYERGKNILDSSCLHLWGCDRLEVRRLHLDVLRLWRLFRLCRCLRRLSSLYRLRLILLHVLAERIAIVVKDSLLVFFRCLEFVTTVEHVAEEVNLVGVRGHVLPILRERCKHAVHSRVVCANLEGAGEVRRAACAVAALAACSTSLAAKHGVLRESSLLKIAMHTALVFAEVCRKVATVLKRLGELVRRLCIIDAILAVFWIVVRHVIDELLVVIKVEIVAVLAFNTAVIVIFYGELAFAAIALM